MTFQKETMTQATRSTSAVQIVHVTIANIYTAAKDSVRKEVLTDAAFLPDKKTAETVHSLSGWAYKSNSQEQRATV